MRRLVDYVLLLLVENLGAEAGDFGEFLERLDCAFVGAVLHHALRLGGGERKVRFDLFRGSGIDVDRLAEIPRQV
jgi:hypothetical protein